MLGQDEPSKHVGHVRSLGVVTTELGDEPIGDRVSLSVRVGVALDAGAYAVEIDGVPDSRARPRAASTERLDIEPVLAREPVEEQVGELTREPGLVVGNEVASSPDGEPHRCLCDSGLSSAELEPLVDVLHRDPQVRR